MTFTTVLAGRSPIMLMPASQPAPPLRRDSGFARLQKTRSEGKHIGRKEEGVDGRGTACDTDQEGSGLHELVPTEEKSVDIVPFADEEPGDGGGRPFGHGHNGKEPHELRKL